MTSAQIYDAETRAHIVANLIANQITIDAADDDAALTKKYSALCSVDGAWKGSARVPALKRDGRHLRVDGRPSNGDGASAKGLARLVTALGDAGFPVDDAHIADESYLRGAAAGARAAGHALDDDAILAGDGSDDESDVDVDDDPPNVGADGGSATVRAGVAPPGAARSDRAAPPTMAQIEQANAKHADAAKSRIAYRRRGDTTPPVPPTSDTTIDLDAVIEANAKAKPRFGWTSGPK